MEFEWKIFSGFTTVGILNKIQQMIGELQCDPENFTGRIIFMPSGPEAIDDGTMPDLELEDPG